MKAEGIRLMEEAFQANRNSSYAFRKLITSLSQEGRLTDLGRVAREFSEYKINQNDPILQRLMGRGGPQGPAGQPPPPTGGN